MNIAMDTTKYVNLPDSLSPDETRGLFKELLALEQSQSAEDAVKLAEAFDEVADRHWHTHTLLDDETRKEVDDWVVRNWDRSSLKKAEALTCVIGKLGLVNAVAMLRRELDHEMPSTVREEIEGALREFGTSVDDPYSGMRKRSR